MTSPNVYYIAAWTDSDFLCGCDHQHKTIISSVVCAASTCAGAYVIAVENWKYRELTRKEELQFQNLMYGNPERVRMLVRWAA